jgi:hypothetical protein
VRSDSLPTRLLLTSRQKHRWKRDVRLTLLRTEALKELSETHSHRTVVTLVIVVLVWINNDELDAP